MHIDSGVVSITAADVLTYGTINSEDIILTGASSAPTTLSIDNGLFGSNSTIELDGHKQVGVLDIKDSVTDNGFIAAHAQTGTIDDKAGGGRHVDHRSWCQRGVRHVDRVEHRR